MIEQERKFLLKYLPEGLPFPVNIKQAYLMLDDKKQQLRVRIIERNPLNKEAYICYKKCLSSTVRQEYEFPISVLEAEELYNSAEWKLEKIRYQIMYKGNNVDIDIYPNELKVCEIEYEYELEEIPDFCGEEVTGQREYSNIYITTGK